MSAWPGLAVHSLWNRRGTAALTVFAIAVQPVLHRQRELHAGRTAAHLISHHLVPRFVEALSRLDPGLTHQTLAAG